MFLRIFRQRNVSSPVGVERENIWKTLWAVVRVGREMAVRGRYNNNGRAQIVGYEFAGMVRGPRIIGRCFRRSRCSTRWPRKKFALRTVYETRQFWGEPFVS